METLRALTGRGTPAVRLLLLFVVGLTVAFSPSAFRIDEPNILAIAAQIASEPLDPYGFSINWLGRTEPAFRILSNPPLVPYWLAAWGTVFGASEVSLRISTLPFTLLLLLSAVAIAKRMEAPPAWVSACVVASPAFLLSSLLTMPDVAAAALATASIAAAMRVRDGGTAGSFWIAAICGAAAPVAKYNAITIVVPLAILAMAGGPRRLSRVAIAASPVIGSLLWAAAGVATYGEPHVLASARFQAGGSDTNVFAAMLPMIGLAVLPWPAVAVRRMGVTWRAVLIAASGVAGAAGGWMLDYSWLPVALVGVGTALGMRALIAIAESAWDNRGEVDAVALAGWVVATLLLQFRLMLLAVRYLLPIVIPAAALLWSRRPLPSFRRGLALGAFGALALALAAGDAIQGNAYRDAIAGLPPDKTIVFDGHWGLQHYAEARGGTAVEAGFRPVLGEQSILVRASHPAPAGVRPVPDAGLVLTSRTIDLESRWPVRTIDCEGAANFHASVIAGCEDVFFAHLPFAFGAGPLDTVTVFEAAPEEERR